MTTDLGSILMMSVILVAAIMAVSTVCMRHIQHIFNLAKKLRNPQQRAIAMMMLMASMLLLVGMDWFAVSRIIQGLDKELRYVRPRATKPMPAACADEIVRVLAVASSYQAARKRRFASIGMRNDWKAFWAEIEAGAALLKLKMNNILTAKLQFWIGCRFYAV